MELLQTISPGGQSDIRSAVLPLGIIIDKLSIIARFVVPSRHYNATVMGEWRRVNFDGIPYGSAPQAIGHELPMRHARHRKQFDQKVSSLGGYHAIESIVDLPRR